MNLKDISRTDGADNGGGLQRFIYAAKLSEIETVPKPVQPDTSSATGTLASLVTIEDDIVMKAYKRFYKIEATLDENQLKGDLQGDIDGKSFKQNIEFYISGSEADLLGFGQMARNSHLILLAANAEGTKYMIGSEEYPAILQDFKWDTAKKADGRKGATVTFMTVGKAPAVIFTGDVDLVGSGYSDGDSEDNQELVFVS